MNVWELVQPYFHRYEAWGNPDKVSRLLLLTLYYIRHESGWPIIIHRCLKQGTAAEWHWQAPQGIKLADQLSRLEWILKELWMLDYCKIEMHPEWTNPGFYLEIEINEKNI